MIVGVAAKRINPRVSKLRAAWLASKMSQDELSKRARLGVTQAAMSRRLYGQTPITLDEYDALTRVLAEWLEKPAGAA